MNTSIVYFFRPVKFLARLANEGAAEHQWRKPRVRDSVKAGCHKAPMRMCYDQGYIYQWDSGGHLL